MANRNQVTETLYMGICNEIKKRIELGVYKKGGLMPSESEIQSLYGVSRVTARKAYKVLVDEGILRTIKGKGTYVNDLDSQDWTWMTSFTRQVLGTGRIPSTKIISFRVVLATETVARFLDIETNTSCYYLKRLRYIDNKPVWLTKSYVPYAVAEGLSREYFSEKGISQSIYKVLEHDFGIPASYSEILTVAVPVTEKDAELLGLDFNKPVISTASIGRGVGGRPVVYETTIFEQSISRKGE